MALVKQVQGQLKVEDGAVAPRRQVAAELAEEQLVRSRARWRGDVSRHLRAAVNPVMDVVTQVSSEIAAVLQNVQRDARKRKKGGDFLPRKRLLLAGAFTAHRPKYVTPETILKSVFLLHWLRTN